MNTAIENERGLIINQPSRAWVDVAPMSTRNQFGFMLNDAGLLGEAVEVGTHRGDFAKVLLTNWRGKLLHCVDPWSNVKGFEEQAGMLDGGGKDRDEDFRMCLRNLRDWIKKGRCRLNRATSAQAAATEYLAGPFDFVYLDGDHRTEMVALDVRLWWPKIRPGGVLAGHDFVCPGEELGGWSGLIQPAVFEFARRENLPIKMVVEEGGRPWSFYVVKPND